MVFEWIRNLFSPPKKIVQMQLDPETVKTHHTIRALANELSEVRAENAKLRVELGKSRESKSDKEEEDEAKLYLEQEKKEIEESSGGSYFSFSKLFRTLFEKKGKNKFAKNLCITTWDRGTRIAKFVDFGLALDGGFVVTGRRINKDGKLGRPSIIMKKDSLPDIFQSIRALSNDVESFKIPVNLDEGGVWMENIIVYETPSIIETPAGKLKYTKAYKKPLFEVLAGKNEELSTLRQEFHEAEMLNIELQNKIDELERYSRISESLIKTSRTETSKNDERLIAIDRVFRDVQKELIHLRTLNVINEDNARKFEEEIDALRKQAQEARTMPQFNNIIQQLDTFKDLLKEKRYLTPAWMQPQTQQQAQGGIK